jgi:uncharacterized membrane protein
VFIFSPEVFSMLFQSRHPLRTFFAGLIALLPLLATVSLLVWFWSVASSWFGPESLVGSALVWLGLGLVGSEAAGYAIGLVIVVISVYIFGLLVEAELQRGITEVVDTVMQRIPVVRTIYDVAQKLVGLMGNGRNQREGVATLSPVWLHFGGVPAEGQPAATTVVLGLLSTPQSVMLCGQPHYAVLVPTAPVPVGGGLMYVPVHWVVPAELSVEALTSIYVSMGVTSGQYLGKPPVQRS